jgi:DNA-binding winged helix-turn-helix (wHTH) protein/tetratricopeptide (TPR) repeat protein
MDAPVLPKRVYRFGLFEADAESGKLLREGMRVKLQDQPFRLLCLLLERAGKVVTREELQQSLWSSNTYVEFEGSLNAALTRLRSALGDSADNPVFIETLPKRGYRFLAPVTIEDSPPSTAQVHPEKWHVTPPATGDDSSQDEVSVLAADAEKAQWRRRLIFGIALALLVVAGVASYHRLTSAGVSKQVRVSPIQPVAPRVSVAVIGFNNISGRTEDAWLSTALAEMLSTELAAGDKLRLVSGEDVAHLRMLAPWMQAGTLAQDTSSRIGISLSTDVLVLGSYASVSKAGKRQLRVDVRLQDASSGNVMTEVAETDNQENLFHLASVVGARLREKLGLPGSTPVEQSAELASMPSNPEGARFYALGLDKLREFDAQTAKDLFEQTIKSDPHFAMAHSMLARALGQLGYEQRRKEEAKTALDLSNNLPRVDRMLAEADYYETQADHEKAASTYRALFALFPDSVEYGLQLITTEGLAGHGDQVLETIAQLRRLPSPASSDPRIDLAEAHWTPSKAAALVLVRNALSTAAAQGKKLTYAQALREECMDLIYGGHPDQALPACEDAYNTFLAAGNRLAAADSLRLIADRQGSEGHMDQAIATYQRALRILQELGEHAKTGIVLNNMAINFANEGKLDRAEEFYRQAKYHFEQIGDKHNTATALGNIADILYLRGNLPGAIKLYRQDMEIEASVVPSSPTYPLYRMADLELVEGKPKEAHDHAKQAVDSLRPDENPDTNAMITLGDVLMAQGDLAGARHSYEQALQIRKKMGQQGLVAETEASLADLSIEEGHPEQAEPLLREATAEFEKENATPAQVSVYTELSKALRKQGKLDEAAKSVAHAAKLGHGNPDPSLDLPLATEQALVSIAKAPSGVAGRSERTAVRRQLESVISTARKLGFYSLECEARLALVELDRKDGTPSADHLAAALEDQTQKNGLLLLSRKAASLRSKPN